jgi:murein DD-endopeptidase MepM/ murein hydrolase activator NlpD
MKPADVAPGCPIITQSYGSTTFTGEWKVAPSVSRTGWFHRGVDLAGPNCCDTPLLAVGDGTVEAVGQTFAGSGGLGPGAILLRLSDGVLAVYGHGYPEVSPGQQVVKGQRIGRVGSQGYSTGCHLHLEICSQLGTVPQGCLDPLAYDGPGGPGGVFMALSDEEQVELLNKAREIHAWLSGRGNSMAGKVDAEYTWMEGTGNTIAARVERIEQKGS